MAKIEEITALLIDEIESFNKSVNALNQSTQKLLEINDKLDNKKIEIDTTKLNKLFSDFYKNINHEVSKNLNGLEKINMKLNTRVIIPKWSIITFITFIIIIIISVFFNYYQFNQRDEIKAISYQKGRKELENHIQYFFRDNPTVEKKYRLWINKNK